MTSAGSPKYCEQGEWREQIPSILTRITRSAAKGEENSASSSSPVMTHRNNSRIGSGFSESHMFADIPADPSCFARPAYRSRAGSCSACEHEIGIMSPEFSTLPRGVRLWANENILVDPGAFGKVRSRR